MKPTETNLANETKEKVLENYQFKELREAGEVQSNNTASWDKKQDHNNGSHRKSLVRTHSW